MSREQESRQDRNSHRRVSRRDIATRIVWGVILLPPLLGWAALGLFAAFRQAPRVNTGDRLLNLFLQELVDRDLIVGPRSAANPGSRDAEYFNNAKLPREVFDSWESEFAKDPRFWLLQSRFTDYDKLRLKDKLRLERVVPLHEAIKLGIADPALIACLLSANDRNWRFDAYGISDLQRPTSTAATVEQWYAYVQLRQRYADSLHAAETNSLLDALLKAAPDQALPQYYAANLAWRRGDKPSAFRLLRDGNVAPQLDGLAGFPWDVASASSISSLGAKDSVLLGGLGAQDVNSVWLLDGARMTMSLASYAAKRGDLDELETLHVFELRYANIRPTNASRVRGGARRLQNVFDAFQTSYSKGITPAQKQALKELQTKINALLDDARALSNQISAMPSAAPPKSLAWWRELATNAATGGRSQAIRELRQKWENAKLEQQGIEQKLRPEIEELLRFDYTTLSWK